MNMTSLHIVVSAFDSTCQSHPLFYSISDISFQSIRSVAISQTLASRLFATFPMQEHVPGGGR